MQQGKLQSCESELYHAGFFFVVGFFFCGGVFASSGSCSEIPNNEVR